LSFFCPSLDLVPIFDEHDVRLGIFKITAARPAAEFASCYGSFGAVQMEDLIFLSSSCSPASDQIRLLIFCHDGIASQVIDRVQE
jgi:hypothetical protein